MYRFRSLTTQLVMFAVLVSSCTAREIQTQPAQPPDEYLSNALDWIETHSVKARALDWASVRAQALALAPDPQTTAETYPAIVFVMEQLGDSATFFLTPDERKDVNAYVGFAAFYPEAVIVGVDPDGPADRAGLQLGDIIVTINGASPKQWQGTRFLDLYDDRTVQLTVRRINEGEPISVTLEKTGTGPSTLPNGRRLNIDESNIGYIELPTTGEDWEKYPTIAQQVIRAVDRVGTCGWIIDVRRNSGGDIWSYIAAIGPILGEGEVGGFRYLDDMHDSWKYKGGQVYWNEEVRAESYVEGMISKLKHSMPPVALLTSHATMAAGELVVVTFQGRDHVRIFGEPSGGSPFLVLHTDLSDGAFIGVSGAFSMDRRGRTYDGSIRPDEVVPTEWNLFSTEQDPVILAANDWLQTQPECAR